MSALAEALVSMGHAVSGADRLVGSTERALWPPSLARLMARGVKIFPDDGSGVDPSVERVVVSTAIEEDNPGLVRARELGIPVVTGRRLLRKPFRRSSLSRLPARAENLLLPPCLRMSLNPAAWIRSR